MHPSIEHSPLLLGGRGPLFLISSSLEKLSDFFDFLFSVPLSGNPVSIWMLDLTSFSFCLFSHLLSFSPYFLGKLLIFASILSAGFANSAITHIDTYSSLLGSLNISLLLYLVLPYEDINSRVFLKAFFSPHSLFTPACLFCLFILASNIRCFSWMSVDLHCLFTLRFESCNTWQTLSTWSLQLDDLAELFPR